MMRFRRGRSISTSGPSRGWSRGAFAALLFAAPLATVVVGGSAARAAVLTGTPTPVAGVASFGIGAGQLGIPGALTVDGKNDVFVADQANNRVEEYVFSSASSSYAKTGVTVAGSGGTGSGPTQLSLGIGLWDQSGLAFDAHGDLFVADSGNNRVQEYSYNSTTGTYAATATTVAGIGGLGSGLTQLNSPTGVAFDAKGDLFVADTANNRVLEYSYSSTAGTFAATGTQVGGTGGLGSGLTQLNSPTGLAFDTAGDLFVVDGGNGRVAEYPYSSATGSYAATATVVASGFSDPPESVAFDANGDLFVSYDYLGYGGVSEFVYNATTKTFAATALSIEPADMVGPTGIAFDSHGDLFVSDTAQTSNPSQTVWETVVEFTYNPSAGTFAPVGTVMGQVGRVNDGINALAVDAYGDVFVSDTVNNTGLNEFTANPTTGAYSPAATSIGAAATAVATDSAGDLFVTNPGGAIGVVSEYVRNPSTGTYPATGVTVPGATQLAGGVVGALAFDKANDIFLAVGDQVLEYAHNSTSGTYSTTGTVVAGTGGTGSGPSQLAGVGGIALDANGDLFVSDPPNARIQEYLLNATTGTYAANGITVAGVGGAGSGLNQLSALTPTSLGGGVAAIAVDQNGDLFAFDAGNWRIMEYTGNAATGTYAAAGTVVASEGQDNSPAQGGVALDTHGDLFFSNNYNSAVVYELVAPTTAPPPAPTVTGITPTGGPAAGGTPVTITGTNLTGGTVAFGTAAATGVTCSASSCTATSPAGTGTVNVTVTTTAGTTATSTADQYTYQAAAPAAPTVTGITPTSGPAAGGTPVTITGTNLTGGTVAFGSAKATGVTCSASSCTATSPAGTGTVNVTVTTSAGTTATSTADQYTYSAAGSSSNLIPNPGFETAGVPADNWGSSLARSQAVVHSGSWSLAQTTTSPSGGWDLDSNVAWCAPITSTKTYTAAIWVRATAAVRVDLNVDLLTSTGNYIDSASGPNITLAANTWTQLSITGVKVTSSEVLAGMEPNFAKATKGTIIYWDDMSLTTP